MENPNNCRSALKRFHKWYKDTRNKIVSVQVDGIPCDEEMDDISPTVDSLKSSDSTDKLSLS